MARLHAFMTGLAGFVLLTPSPASLAVALLHLIGRGVQ